MQPTERKGRKLTADQSNQWWLLHLITVVDTLGDYWLTAKPEQSRTATAGQATCNTVVAAAAADEDDRLKKCFVDFSQEIFMRWDHQGNRDRKRGLGSIGYGTDDTISTSRALPMFAHAAPVAPEIRHQPLARCFFISSACMTCPHGTSFTWWGCYGLCFRRKPTDLALSSFFPFF